MTVDRRTWEVEREVLQWCKNCLLVMTSLPIVCYEVGWRTMSIVIGNRECTHDNK